MCGTVRYETPGTKKCHVHQYWSIIHIKHDPLIHLSLLNALSCFVNYSFAYFQVNTNCRIGCLWLIPDKFPKTGLSRSEIAEFHR